MKRIAWISLAAAIAVGIGLAQGPADRPVAPVNSPTNVQTPGNGQTKNAKGTNAKGRGRGAPRDPAQSPRFTARTADGDAADYAAEQIKPANSASAHGAAFVTRRDAAGGEGGPDLTRSELVAQDLRRDKIAPLIRTGRGAMQPFPDLSDPDVNAIVAFVHDQKPVRIVRQKNPHRRSRLLLTGDTAAGQRYFNGAGGCSACHSATSDLAGIATGYQDSA